MGEAKQRKLHALEAVEHGGSVDLSEQATMRLYELFMVAVGAKSVADVAVQAANDASVRYNAALSAVKDTLDIPPDAKLNVNFVERRIEIAPKDEKPNGEPS